MSVRGHSKKLAQFLALGLIGLCFLLAAGYIALNRDCLNADYGSNVLASAVFILVGSFILTLSYYGKHEGKYLGSWIALWAMLTFIAALILTLAVLFTQYPYIRL